MLVFFFSSRRRHTRCSRDWSSDVCSSDLKILGVLGRSHPFNTVRAAELQRWIAESQYERILAGDYPKRGPEAEQRPIDRDIDEARDHYMKEAKAVVNDVVDTAKRAAQAFAEALKKK